MSSDAPVDPSLLVSTPAARSQLKVFLAESCKAGQPQYTDSPSKDWRLDISADDGSDNAADPAEDDIDGTFEKCVDEDQKPPAGVPMVALVSKANLFSFIQANTYCCIRAGNDSICSDSVIITHKTIGLGTSISYHCISCTSYSRLEPANVTKPISTRTGSPSMSQRHPDWNE